MALTSAWEARYPHPWLIWEPGVWKVPSSTNKLAATQCAESAPDRPQKGDCLCFELRSTTGTLRVGRAPENEIVINDATVSREHLVLVRVGAVWNADALPGAKNTAVRGVPLVPGTRVELASGDRLSVGGVTLSYLSPDKLKLRLQAEAKRLSQSGNASS